MNTTVHSVNVTKQEASCVWVGPTCVIVIFLLTAAHRVQNKKLSGYMCTHIGHIPVPRMKPSNCPPIHPFLYSVHFLLLSSQLYVLWCTDQAGHGDPLRAAVVTRCKQAKRSHGICGESRLRGLITESTSHVFFTRHESCYSLWKTEWIRSNAMSCECNSTTTRQHSINITTWH